MDVLLIFLSSNLFLVNLRFVNSTSVSTLCACKERITTSDQNDNLILPTSCIIFVFIFWIFAVFHRIGMGIYFAPHVYVVFLGEYGNMREGVSFLYVRFFLYFCSMKIIIINGPNLNLLGIRQPEIYGHRSFEDYLQQLCRRFPQVDVEYYQSNVEGELINKLHEVGFSYDGIVLNAGGYSHTSVALHDAVSSISTPVVEVHISNIYAREEYRRHSMLSDVCKGVVCGLGLDGYRFAVESFLQ